ncbi:MAG: PEGA domain-containing protein [Treponema sp.]|nr:PEGA domain-containing protein [Treponema sp.]
MKKEYRGFRRPPYRFLFALICLCLLPRTAFGRGGEEEEKTYHHGEWILCVTGFDVSAMPPARRIAGEVMVRGLVESLNAVDRRIRVSREYAWYEEYVWTQSRQTAAKALEAKRGERDALLYKGDPSWRYRRAIKTVDGEIRELEKKLRETERNAPLIASEPVLQTTDGNRGGTFPPPPAAGEEYAFCRKEKADAFLAGSVSEFHNRLYVKLRLYTVYTGSYVYEDDILFSQEDMNDASAEMSGRLAAAVSGTGAALVAVNADPENAMVLINGAYAGRGRVPPREHIPGTVTVSISAEEHETMTAEVELKAGETTEIAASLRPLGFSAVRVFVPGQVQAQVYQGALYAGDAPFTLRLPVNQYGYVTVEIPDGRFAQAVFLNEEKSWETSYLSLKPGPRRNRDERRVDKARRAYYWVWGGVWVLGASAWIINGISNAEIAGFNASQNQTTGMLDRAQLMYYLNIGGIAVVSAAVIAELAMMSRYVYTAGSDAPPVVRLRKNNNRVEERLNGNR